MGNADKAKRKAEKQRLKTMKAYFNSIGDTILDGNHVKYFVLGKHRLDNEYYFVVQDINGILYLQKIVYGNSIRIVNVSREGRQYAKNRNVFDTWFEVTEKKRTTLLENYYNKVNVGETCKDGNYILLLKKQYNGKYYFILEDSNGRYVVAKLGWWYTKVRVQILSDNEYAKNRYMFSDWIREANIESLLRKMRK